MNVVPFHPGHLRRMRLRDGDSHVLGYLNGLSDDDDVKIRFGDAYTGLDGDKVVVCAGVVPLHAGVGQAWCILSSHADQYPVAVTRAVLRFLADDATNERYHRIQAEVKAGWEKAERWAEVLGFENETPSSMRAFGADGADYCLYARVM